MSKTQVVVLVVLALAAGTAVGVLGLAPQAERATAARHGIPAEDAEKLLKQIEYDVDTRGALRLPAWDEETNLHTRRPEAYNRRRAAERLEAEYRTERKRRIALTNGIVDAAKERLALSPEQAATLYSIIMERGDVSRIACYLDLFGAHAKRDKQNAMAEAGFVFDAKLKLLLNGEQLRDFRALEEEQGAGVKDLGFGAAYGRGGGKDRATEPLPEKKN